MNKIADGLTYGAALHKLLVAFHRGEVWHMRREGVAWFWYLATDDAGEFEAVGPVVKFSDDFGETLSDSLGGQLKLIQARKQRSREMMKHADWCIYAPADEELSQPYDPIAQRNRIGNAIVAAVEKRGFKARWVSPSVSNDDSDTIEYEKVDFNAEWSDYDGHVPSEHVPDAWFSVGLESIVFGSLPSEIKYVVSHSGLEVANSIIAILTALRGR